MLLERSLRSSTTVLNYMFAKAGKYPFVHVDMLIFVLSGFECMLQEVEANTDTEVYHAAHTEDAGEGFLCHTRLTNSF